jgi:hypothetical protein
MLNAELARFRQTSNPLPPPPEPLPLDQLPSFVRPLADRSSSQSASNGTSQTVAESSYRVPNNQIDDDRYSHGHSVYATDNDHPSLRLLMPSAQADLTKVAEIDRSLRKASRMGFQKQSQQTIRHEYTYPPSHVQVPPSTSETQYPHSNGHRVGIIPGAPPTQRIIPPRPRWTDTDLQAQTPIERPWRERPESEWDRDRARSFEDMTDDTMRSAQQALREVLGNGTTPTHPRTVEEALDPGSFAPAAAYISEYASGYGSGYTMATNSDLVYGDAYLPESPELGYVPEEHEGLGLFGVPPPVLSGFVTSNPRDSNPTPRPTQLHRRNTTSSMAVSEPDPIIPAARTVHTTLTRGSDGITAAEGSVAVGERESVASWGTIRTRQTVQESSSGRGSLSDLGLVGLHRGGGVRGTGTIVESVPATPARLGNERRGVVGQEEVTAQITTEERSPVYLQASEQGSSSGLLSESAHGGISTDANSDRRPRHLRSISHPDIPVPTQDATERQSRRAPRANRVDHHRNSRRSSSSGQQMNTARLPLDDSHNTSSGTNHINALALMFDQSPDLSIRSHSQNEPHSFHPPHIYPNISAPTPIVSTRNIMRSWTVDT